MKARQKDGRPVTDSEYVESIQERITRLGPRAAALALAEAYGAQNVATVLARACLSAGVV